MNTPIAKTIRMPKPLLDKWLAALRSGEYRQVFGRLEKEGGYCCLGVLQHCLTGEVEGFCGDLPEYLPSVDWLESRGIKFLGRSSDRVAAPTAPFLPTLGMYAQEANDGQFPVDYLEREPGDNFTFPEIADAIEACAEGYEP